MNETEWGGYQISLQHASPQVATAPVQKPVQSRLAGRGTRGLAVLADWILIHSPVVVGLLITRQAGENSATTMSRLGIWLGGTGVILIAQIVLLSLRGQTFGKIAVGVRIVDYRDDSNPGFVRAVVLRSFVPGVLGAIPCVGLLFVLWNYVSIFGEDRRCLHDVFAATKVVEQ